MYICVYIYIYRQVLGRGVELRDLLCMKNEFFLIGEPQGACAGMPVQACLCRRACAGVPVQAPL